MRDRSLNGGRDMGGNISDVTKINDSNVLVGALNDGIKAK